MRTSLLPAVLVAALSLVAVRPAEAQVAVGSDAPELQFQGCRNVDGTLAQLADLRGAAVLLEFSATWCGPCRAQVPHMNELHGTFADRGLVVLGVMDEDAAKIDPWLAQFAVAHPIALTAKGHGMATYGIRGIPTAVLVLPDGKVGWVGHPGQLTAATVEAALVGASNPFGRLKDQLEPVQGLLDRGQRGKGLSMLALLQKSGRLDGPVKERAAAAQRRLEMQAAAMLARAARHADTGELFAAVLLWHELALQFEGHAAAVAAAARLSALAPDEEQAPAFAAAGCIARARALAAQRRYDEAIAEYEKACIGEGAAPQLLARAAIEALESKGLRGYRTDCADCVAAKKACGAHARQNTKVEGK